MTGEKVKNKTKVSSDMYTTEGRNSGEDVNYMGHRANVTVMDGEREEEEVKQRERERGGGVSWLKAESFGK